jgi:hypothetical protein
VLDPLSLLGPWSLHRTIEDRVAGETTTVTGTLTLSRDGEDVAWREVGEWSRRGALLPVERTLRVVRRDVHQEAAWWVLFEDGREFHPWSPGEPVVHPCGADTYRGLVEGTPQAWRVTWEVRGPAKDYTMLSELSGTARPASA